MYQWKQTSAVGLPFQMNLVQDKNQILSRMASFIISVLCFLIHTCNVHMYRWVFSGIIFPNSIAIGAEGDGNYSSVSPRDSQWFWLGSSGSWSPHILDNHNHKAIIYLRTFIWNQLQLEWHNTNHHFQTWHPADGLEMQFPKFPANILIRNFQRWNALIFLFYGKGEEKEDFHLTWILNALN